MPEVTPCVILLEKNPNFMQFYKIVPARLPRRFGTARPGAPQLWSKKPNFMQFYENSGAREQTGLLPKCRTGRFHASQPMTSPSKNISMKGPLNCRSLGCPGFPVKLGGVGELHAPFLTERRTRDRVRRSVAANPGTLGMTKGRANASMEGGCWREAVSSPARSAGSPATRDKVDVFWPPRAANVDNRTFQRKSCLSACFPQWNIPQSGTLVPLAERLHLGASC